MVVHFAADWPTWEIHPDGDELVTMLSGAMDFVLRLPKGDRVVPLRAGSSCVVPANTWHTARVGAPCSAQFITPCRGTRNAATPD
jgi:mannose-6-phosphate isomerase-like protein (cupin superfamily)